MSLGRLWPAQRIDQWVRRERRFRKCGPRAEAENALVPVYRKELRKVLLEYLWWLRAIKKDPTFHKVIETQREFEDTEGFDWLESTEPGQFLVCNHVTSSHVWGQYYLSGGRTSTDFISLSFSCLLAMTDARSCLERPLATKLQPTYLETCWNWRQIPVGG